MMVILNSSPPPAVVMFADPVNDERIDLSLANIATDTNGNVWIMNHSSMTELKQSENGSYSPVIFSKREYGFHNPSALAVDNAGNVWVANSGNNSVTEIQKNQAGTYSPVIFNSAAAHFNVPIAITTDYNGNVWVVNDPDTGDKDNSITELQKNAEGSYTPQVFTAAKYGFNYLRAISVDPAGNVWVTDMDGVTELQKTGSNDYKAVVFNDASYDFNLTSFISADANGNVWVTHNHGVTEIKKNAAGSYSAVVFPAPADARDFGFNNLAIDPKGDVWVTYFESEQNKIAVLQQDSTGEYHFKIYGGAHYGFDLASGIAADLQGNIWVMNAGNNTVTEIKNP